MRATIITPTFNAARFVEACIRGVGEQGDAVLEHLVADGGSTDGTVETVMTLARDFPRVRLIPGPDRGQSDAMNKATAQAAGEVVGVLNVDDYYEPRAVARGIARLAAFAAPGLVVGDCRIVDAAGETVMWNRPKDLRIESLLQDSHLFPIPANPSAYFYHRQVHEIVGGYDVDDHFAMDLEFLLRCARLVKTRYVPEHWGNFRYIPGSKTFEDADGKQRVSQIIARHRGELSALQRARMRAIGLAQRLRSRAARMLRTT